MAEAALLPLAESRLLTLAFQAYQDRHIVEAVPLQLAFDTKDIRKVCELEYVARNLYGADVAAALRERLSDLLAATSVHDLLVGRPRVISQNPGVMALDITGKYRLLFCANHISPPLTSAGLTDWINVSRIKVSRIEAQDD
jgi:hypothetical protein